MGIRAMQEATFLILTSLAGGSQHGYGIITDVEQISDGRVRLRAGTLYTALDRLRVDRLIDVDREEIVENRLRRYYRLTSAGERRLADEAARLQANAVVAISRLHPAGQRCDEDGAPDLERRYRRLLKCFPARYRREHEQEILSVLMAGAREGQRRPGPADSADLVMSAIFMRWRELTRQPRWQWERRHPRLIVRVRVTIGILALLAVGAILLGDGYWWGVLIFLPAALHFYLAYKLRHAVQS